MDEPLSNLDLKLREGTRTELKKLHEQLKVTAVYVTHDQAEALVLSNRIGVMKSGDLIQVGTPQEIYDKPSNIFVAKFVGTPSINLVPVTVEQTGDHLRLIFRAPELAIAGGPFPVDPVASARLRSAGGPLVLGIRPEAIALMHQPGAGYAPGRIDIVEPMGSVNHVIVNLDGLDQIAWDNEPFVAVATSNEIFLKDSPSWITVRPDRLVIFDTSSGAALASLSAARTWQ